MVVSITWATSSGGDALSEPVSHGSVSNGGAGPVLDLYIRHDASSNPITDVGFFIAPYSGSNYTGVGEQDDYLEILNWGVDMDPSTLMKEGGFYINQNLYGGFPDDSWVVHKAGQGDSANPIELDSQSISGGSGLDGEIGVGEEAQVEVQLVIPSAEDTAGIRFFDQVLAYTFTS